MSTRLRARRFGRGGLVNGALGEADDRTRCGRLLAQCGGLGKRCRRRPARRRTRPVRPARWTGQRPRETYRPFTGTLRERVRTAVCERRGSTRLRSVAARPRLGPARPGDARAAGEGGRAGTRRRRRDRRLGPAAIRRPVAVLDGSVDLRPAGRPATGRPTPGAVALLGWSFADPASAAPAAYLSAPGTPGPLSPRSVPSVRPAGGCAGSGGPSRAGSGRCGRW